MTHRPAPPPDNEEERILSLEHLGVLDSEPEQSFDDVVLLAKTLCNVPIALVSLVDRERQWFKACVGLDVRETHRDLAFCAHAILAPAEVLVVEDTLQDPRFQHSALVLGPPFIRFYAGAPIRSDSGLPMGTVCVIDTQPRSLSEPERVGLLALARQTAALLELRLLNQQREEHANELLARLDESQGHSREVELSLRHAQRVSSLGMVTASIAHDFNNLLQALYASFQLVRMRARRPTDVEQLSDTGLQAVEQGRQLVNQLMACVRQDGSDLICVDISERVEAMQELLLHTVTTDISLSFDLKARGFGVLCDETQLQAVLINLLVNARDALAGSGQVHVATGHLSIEDDLELTQGDYLVLSVTDNGPGMDSEIAAKVFEPFFTTKPLGKGTGLGLSRVREFALSAGGGVKVNTAPGIGTTMSLYLRALGRVDSYSSD